jgi:SulP family sulfate permease
MGWLFFSLRGYHGSWVRGDLLAGLSVWAVLVPEALAYASIAGVSPVVGLYASPAALVLYAALGSSRQLIVGPMSAAAILSAATVGALVPVGSDRFATLTAALAIITGLAALVAGLLRLGFLANFISEPVLKGFIVGLSLTIIARQLAKLLGIAHGSGDFFAQLWHVITHLGDVHGLTLVVGVLSLAVIIALRRVAPGIPGYLVAVLLGIAAVKLFDLDQHGVEIVGSIKSGLPTIGVPDIQAGDVGALAAGGVGLMLVGYAEGLAAAKTYAARAHQQIDANRELLGLGAANLGSALSSGMVVGGSLSKTAVNASAGSRSQLSGLIVAALTIVTLVALTGLFEDLPTATLAAIVVAAVIDLVDVPALLSLYRAYSRRLSREFGLVARPDFVAAIAALLGVLVFDPLPGLFIGITVSLLLLIYRASRPYVATLGKTVGPDGQYRDIDRHRDARPPEHIAVLRVESGLYFANADAVRTRILQAATPEHIRAVVLDAETTPFIDVTAARMLADLTDELPRARNSTADRPRNRPGPRRPTPRRGRPRAHQRLRDGPSSRGRRHKTLSAKPIQSNSSPRPRPPPAQSTRASDVMVPRQYV